jgi:S1-C subfamily serine protease
MKRTLYQILGVEKDAPADAITAAYRTRLAAAQAAPGGDATATTLLREAYQVLSNPQSRNAYDASLAAPVPSAASRRGRAAPIDDDEPGTGWIKWAIGGTVVVLALGIWWWKARPAPKPEGKVASQVVITRPAAPLAAPAPAVEAPAPAAAASAAPTSAAPAAERSAEEIFAAVSPSVARVNAQDASGRQTTIGSGVVVGRGTVITNCHVVARASTVQVKVGKDTYPASVDVADEEFDLCRLGVPGLDAPAVAVGSVAGVRTGQRVYTIGAPQGLDLTISDGIVSSLREVQGGTVIQTTAPVSRGSSGGGLFDQSGQLVGIVTFQHRYGQNLNFAVPVDWIGEMRTRSASATPQSDVASRAAPAVAAQAQAGGSFAQLIVGAWQCFGSVSGRSGSHTYGADGTIRFVTNDGLREAGRYTVAGRSVRYSMPTGSFSFAIEHLDAQRMVLNIGIAGQRVACDRR